MTPPKSVEQTGRQYYPSSYQTLHILRAKALPKAHL